MCLRWRLKYLQNLGEDSALRSLQEQDSEVEKAEEITSGYGLRETIDP